jgi:hypothetical protein
MAVQNLVSASLGPEAQAEIRSHLEAIKARLGFLTSLRGDEVHGLVKAGKGFAPLLDKAYETVSAHPEIMPAIFPLAEFKKDYELYKSLAPIAGLVEELAESLQKTMIALSSDTMVETLDIYGAVKQSAGRIPGLKVVADDMGSFFARPKRAKSAT